MSEMIDLSYSGKSLKVIAVALNTSQAIVSRTLAKLDLWRDPIRRKVTDQEILATNHLSYHAAGGELGISHQAVHERRIILGVRRPLHTLIDQITDANRTYKLDLQHFTNLDKIGCYWLGFLYADGCNRQHGRTTVTPSTISMTLQRPDRQMLALLLSDLDAPNRLLYDYSNGKYTRVMLHHRRFGMLMCSLGMMPGPEYKRHLPVVPYLDQFTTVRSECGIKIGGSYKSKSIYTTVSTHRQAEALGAWIWADPIRAMPRKMDNYLSWRSGHD